MLKAINAIRIAFLQHNHRKNTYILHILQGYIEFDQNNIQKG